jgi:hypothetical protein
MTTRRFPPAWSTEELEACFVVRDHGGQQLGHALTAQIPNRRYFAGGPPLTRTYGSPSPRSAIPRKRIGAFSSSGPTLACTMTATEKILLAWVILNLIAFCLLMQNVPSD